METSFRPCARAGNWDFSSSIWVKKKPPIRQKAAVSRYSYQNNIHVKFKYTTESVLHTNGVFLNLQIMLWLWGPSSWKLNAAVKKEIYRQQFPSVDNNFPLPTPNQLTLPLDPSSWTLNVANKDIYTRPIRQCRIG